MSILKVLIKQSISSAVALFSCNRVGAHVLTTFVNQLMGGTAKVSHKGMDMLFSIPNTLTRYRATSFSTKEPETLAWLESIPEGAVLWDIGANVGLYSIYAARKVNARVFAFEPSVFNLELLARNIFLNRLQERVTIVPVALSDALGPSLFRMTSTAWGGALSTFGQNFDQHGETLHSVFEYQTMGLTMVEAHRLLQIPLPQYIKIDVDGIEHFILRGGAEVLKHVESVLIEINDDFTQQAEESSRLLQNAGLTLLRKSDIAAGNQYNQWWVRESV
jgi:FkbM family methyltransferase